MNNIALSSSCCGYVRMAPAAVTLAVSVMGVVLGMIYRIHYVSAIAGAGTLSSCYLMYLAHEYRHLQDFATNNQLLRKEVEELQAENATFKENLRVFEEQTGRLERQIQDSAQNLAHLSQEVQTLSVTNLSLGGTAEQLRAENGDLNQTKTQLQQQVLQLQEANTSLDKGLKQTSNLYHQQLERLSALNSALERMKDSDSITFKELLASLGKEIAHFEHLQSQRDQMSETATHLKGLLERLHSWENDGTRNKLIRDLEMLHGIHAKIQAQVGEARAQGEILKNENKKLEEFNNALSQKLNDLQAKLSRLGQETDDLSKIKTDLRELVAQIPK